MRPACPRPDACAEQVLGIGAENPLSFLGWSRRVATVVGLCALF
jgi:hypothetical protein